MPSKSTGSLNAASSYVPPDAYGTPPPPMPRTMSPLDAHNKQIQSQGHLKEMNVRAMDVPVYDARSLTANVVMKRGQEGEFMLKPIQKGNPKISFQSPTLHYNRVGKTSDKLKNVTAFITNKDMLPHMTFNGKEYWLLPLQVGNSIESDPGFVSVPMDNGKSYMFNVNNGVNQEFDPKSTNYNKDKEEKQTGCAIQ